MTATIVNDGCMTPWDVIKQRMQVSHSPFKSLGQCIRETWRQGGIAAFYKSYWTTVSSVSAFLVHGIVISVSFFFLGVGKWKLNWFKEKERKRAVKNK